MSFGKRLRKYREHAGFSQKGFAEKIGLTRDLYNKYENDKNRPSFETIGLICNELNISSDFLLSEHDEVELISDKHRPALNSLPKISGINESGEYVSEFSEQEALEIIKDIFNFPDEAMGDLKIMFEVLNAKYSKGK